MTQYDYAHLPGAMAAIQADLRTGSLCCTTDDALHDLFFVGGRLVHAEAQPSDDQGEDALYSLLIVRDGTLAWHDGGPPIETTIHADVESAFMAAMAALQKRGVLRPTVALDLDALAAAKQPSLAVGASTIAKDPAPITVVPLATYTPPQFVFPSSQSSILLPPPTFEEDVDRSLPVSETFTRLHESQFSGYVVAGTAVILFEVGQPTLARYKNLTGQEALDSSMHTLAPQHVRYYRSDARLLAAFRALFGGHNAYKDVRATTDTLTGLLGAFTRGHSTGAIVVRGGSQTLYYLIHSGTSHGLFAPDATGMLHGAADRLPPGADAQFDVYLTRTPENIVLPSVLPSPASLPLYNRTLHNIVQFIGQITSAQHAEFELNTVLAVSRSQYPAVALLNTGIQTEVPSWLAATAKRSTTDSLTNAAFEHVVNTYLEPYARRVGAAQLAAMLGRALGNDLTDLQQNGVRIEVLRQAEYAQPAAQVASDSAFDF